MDGSALAETDSAFHASRSGVKHHWKKDWKGKHQKKDQYEYEGKHGGQQQPPSARKESGKSERTNMIRGYYATTSDADEITGNNESAATSTSTPSAVASHGKRGKDYKRVRSRYSSNALYTANQSRSPEKCVISLLVLLHSTCFFLLVVQVRQVTASLSGRNILGCKVRICTSRDWAGQARRRGRKREENRPLLQILIHPLGRPARKVWTATWQTAFHLSLRCPSPPPAPTFYPVPAAAPLAIHLPPCTKNTWPTILVHLRRLPAAVQRYLLIDLLFLHPGPVIDVSHSCMLLGSAGFFGRMIQEHGKAAKSRT